MISNTARKVKKISKLYTISCNMATAINTTARVASPTIIIQLKTEGTVRYWFFQDQQIRRLELEMFVDLLNILSLL